MIKLKDILKEYTPSDPDSLTKALKDIRSLGVPNWMNSREIVINNSVLVEIGIFDKRLWFSSIHSLDRGQGNAGKVMQQIVDIADKHGVTIALTPKPFGGKNGSPILTKSQLVAFYKKYGFKPEKGGFGDMERVANKI
jgi:GNAT superfamily N-acetyltransferase